MRKRDENSGEIKETLEKKEYAGKIPCRRNGTIEPCSHYMRVVTLFFLFYFVRYWRGVELRRKFQYRKTDGTVIITCLAVHARSRRPHTHGLVTRPVTNVIRFTRRAESHFPPSSDLCLRQSSLPQITPKKKLFLPTYVERKTI